MRYEQWAELYKPVKNELRPNANLEGCLFETFGPELDRVLNEANSGNENKVWTLIDAGDEHNSWVVGNGYQLVNRIGYLITEVPFVPTQTQPCLDVLYDSDEDVSGGPVDDDD